MLFGLFKNSDMIGIPPVGSMLEYAGAGDPADPQWLLADGRLVLRTDYPVLFAVIGTTYGTTLSTNFRLPDSRGRVGVAPDNMGTAQGAAGRLTSGNTLGASGGVQTHNHTGTTPDHLHTAGSYYAPDHGHHMSFISACGTASRGSANYGSGGGEGVAFTNHVHTVTTTGDTWGSGNLGIGGASGASDRSLAFTVSTVSSMIPYYIANKIIRVF